MRWSLPSLVAAALLLGACTPQRNLASACGYGDPEACAAMREGRSLPNFRPGAFVPAPGLNDTD